MYPTQTDQQSGPNQPVGKPMGDGSAFPQSDWRKNESSNGGLYPPHIPPTTSQSANFNYLPPPNPSQNTFQMYTPFPTFNSDPNSYGKITTVSFTVR
jgi:hypothetical protein